LDIPTARRKAEIAYRKRQNRLQEAASSNPEVTKSKPQSYVATLPADAQRDFHIIAKFFAVDGGGDEGDDDQVWASIENKVSCRILA
jgi:hypothetical protein